MDITDESLREYYTEKRPGEMPSGHGKQNAGIAIAMI